MHFHYSRRDKSLVRPTPRGKLSSFHLLPHLSFATPTPTAPQGLGGLVREHFGNGRLYASVAAHGGLTNVSFWGRQHGGASEFFRGGLESAWTKLFRYYVTLGGKRLYPVLNQTRLLPFGFESSCVLERGAIAYDLLLLPDALVQRVTVTDNLGNSPAAMGMLHQEAITAIAQQNRTWEELTFHPELNAFVTSCTDTNPAETYRDIVSLAQDNAETQIADAPHAVTWIGIGSDHALTTHRGYHPRSKHYISSSDLRGKRGAIFVVFALSRTALIERLKELAWTVQKECDALVAGYERRLTTRPRIDVGSPALNSAFAQYPEMIHHMKLPDRPGATRATLAGYFVWGWDGMTPTISCPLANEAEYAAQILRFFQETRDPKVGLPHLFTTDFKVKYKTPFPAQCQFIIGLYHYVALTGNLKVAREVWPTCRFLLERCRTNEVAGTGLVSGVALWPDFPEAMEEDGHDISSLNNSLLYQALRGTEYLALTLGDAALANECRDWAKRLRTSFVKHLYDEEKGYFISSCSSVDFKPRRHYCAQAIFWVTPFARELVSHAPRRIADFMQTHLRASKCLLTLPHWDTAWMADGNQLGSSYPPVDYFYLNVHRLLGEERAAAAWLRDVEWFWRHHTAPEAFTPEADNEEELGPDNWGCKQCQCCTTWYASLYTGLAGLDFDHEGLTLTPWGSVPVSIRGLRVRRTTSVDLTITGRGNHIGRLKLNGRVLPAGSRKIGWSALRGKTARLELVRTTKSPRHPVIVRADGLQVQVAPSVARRLVAKVSGKMSGEVVIEAPRNAQIILDGREIAYSYDVATGTFTVPVEPGTVRLEAVV